MLTPFTDEPDQTDAELWDALRRSFLVENDKDKEEIATDGVADATQNQHRFHLETKIEAEGANLSVGERSLLSLARALVKDSQVVGALIFLYGEQEKCL